MADRPGDSRDDQAVSEPVLEWLDEIAEAEDLSREAAVEYLISSYWRLEEIVDLLEAGDGHLETDAVDEPTASDRTDVDSLNDRFDTLLEDLRARDEASDERGELLTSIVELGDRIERLEGRLADETESGLDDALATLEARIESLDASTAALEDDVERLDADAVTDVSPLEDRLESVAAATSDLQARVARLDEATEDVSGLGAQLDSLAAEVSALQGRVEAIADETVSDETFAAVTQQTRSFQGSMTRRHESLRDRVQTEFTHIRTILTHLLDASATTEHRTERVLDDFKQTFRAHLASREKLEAIVRTANRRGVRAATCEQCGERVHLGMLQSPVCPRCEHEFADIESTTGLLGLRESHVLTVTAESGSR